jgi:hypothetical protein
VVPDFVVSDWRLPCHALGERVGIPLPLTADALGWSSNPDGYRAYEAWVLAVGHHLIEEETESYYKRPGKPKGHLSKTPPPSKRAEIQRRYRRKLARKKGGNGNSK